MGRKPGQKQITLDDDMSARLKDYCERTGGFAKGVVQRALWEFLERMEAMVPPAGHPNLPGIPPHGMVLPGAAEYVPVRPGTSGDVPSSTVGTACNSRSNLEHAVDLSEREKDQDHSLSVPAKKATEPAPEPAVRFTAMPGDWPERGKPEHPEAIGHDELTHLAGKTLSTGLTLPEAFREALRRHPADAVRSAALACQERGRKPPRYWLETTRNQPPPGAQPRRALRVVPSEEEARCGSCHGRGKRRMEFPDGTVEVRPCGICDGTGKRKREAS